MVYPGTMRSPTTHRNGFNDGFCGSSDRPSRRVDRAAGPRESRHQYPVDREEECQHRQCRAIVERMTFRTSDAGTRRDGRQHSEDHFRTVRAGIVTNVSMSSMTPRMTATSRSPRLRVGLSSRSTT